MVLPVGVGDAEHEVRLRHLRLQRHGTLEVLERSCLVARRVLLEAAAERPDGSAPGGRVAAQRHR